MILITFGVSMFCVYHLKRLITRVVITFREQTTFYFQNN